MGIVAEAEGQLPRQRRIKLDAVQPAAALCQQLGDRSVPGADLDHRSLARIAKRFGDLQAGVLIHQKILAQLRFLVRGHR